MKWFYFCSRGMVVRDEPHDGTGVFLAFLPNQTALGVHGIKNFTIEIESKPERLFKKDKLPNSIP